MATTFRCVECGKTRDKCFCDEDRELIAEGWIVPETFERQYLNDAYEMEESERSLHA